MTTASDHTALVDELIALVGAGPPTLAARLRDLKSSGQPLADILNSLSSKKTLVLHQAAFRSRNLESTSLLLAAGAAPNAKDGNGSTCLHYLAVPSGDEGRDEAIMALLLSNGALLRGDSVLNKSGATPMELLEDHCRGELVGRLLLNLKSLPIKPSGGGSPGGGGGSGSSGASGGTGSGSAAPPSPAAIAAMKVKVEAWSDGSGDSLLVGMKRALMDAGIPAAADLPDVTYDQLRVLTKIRPFMSTLKKPFEKDLPPERAALEAVYASIVATLNREQVARISNLK